MDTVRAALRSLFPPEVALEVWEGDEEPPAHPEEGDSLARAIAQRVTEFRRGRACARAALGRLGAAGAAIPVGADRAPLWPVGYVGAITHCAGLVAAVAARSDRIAALGLDAEPAKALPEGTEPLILHPLERAGARPDPLDMVVFSAKESVFKAVFPSTRTWLDFRDVVLRLDEASGSFAAEAAPDASASVPFVPELRGGYRLSAGFVLTGCWLARR